jgi:hypothetical protein
MGYEVTYDAHSALPPGQDTGPDTTTYSHQIYCTIRTSTCLLKSAAKTLWEFGLAGGRSVTVSASRHRSTDLICM